MLDQIYLAKDVILELALHFISFKYINIQLYVFDFFPFLLKHIVNLFIFCYNMFIRYILRVTCNFYMSICTQKN